MVNESEEYFAEPGSSAAQLRKSERAAALAPKGLEESEGEGNDRDEGSDYVPDTPTSSPPAPRSTRSSALKSVKETPENHLLFEDRRLSPQDEKRVKKACNGDLRCAISWEMGKSIDPTRPHIDYCHIVPSKWAASDSKNSLEGKRLAKAIHLLGFVLGFEPGTLNLNTRRNIILLKSDWHRLFDGTAFMLVPKEETVINAVIDFFDHNFAAMSTWTEDDETRYMFKKYDSLPIDNHYVYRVVPLEKWPDELDIVRRRKQPLQVDSGQRNMMDLYMWYPFPGFRNPSEEAEPEPLIESHVHPLFVAIHAAWQYTLCQTRDLFEGVNLTGEDDGFNLAISFCTAASSLFDDDGEFYKHTAIQLPDEYVIKSRERMKSASDQDSPSKAGSAKGSKAPSTRATSTKAPSTKAPSESGTSRSTGSNWKKRKFVND